MHLPSVESGVQCLKFKSAGKRNESQVIWLFSFISFRLWRELCPQPFAYSLPFMFWSSVTWTKRNHELSRGPLSLFSFFVLLIYLMWCLILAVVVKWNCCIYREAAPTVNMENHIYSFSLFSVVRVKMKMRFGEGKWTFEWVSRSE